MKNKFDSIFITGLFVLLLILPIFSVLNSQYTFLDTRELINDIENFNFSNLFNNKSDEYISKMESLVNDIKNININEKELILKISNEYNNLVQEKYIEDYKFSKKQRKRIVEIEKDLQEYNINILNNLLKGLR